MALRCWPLFYLEIPDCLALELYRIDILPQNPAEKVTVKVGGKKVGQVKVVDFQ